MIQITFLGTGGATPYKGRTTPMLAVAANSHSMLFDCGSGATLRLAECEIKAGSIQSLFFTHFHADHCVDFPVFVLTSYLGGRVEPLKVFGPKGTRRFVRTMLEDLFPYIPKLIKGITGTPFTIEVDELGTNEVRNFEGVVVTAACVVHSVPALAYRVSTEREVICISGDTEYSEEVIRLAQASQILVHECPFPVAMGKVPDHTTAQQVGEVAGAARVNTLVLTHLFEEVVGGEAEMKRAIGEHFEGKVVFGKDLMRLRVDGAEVTFGN